jgi:hypothetical protein
VSLVDRVKGILLTPRKEWAIIDGESATVQGLYTGYIIPLAAIPAIAGFIGMSVVGFGSVMGMSIKAPIGTGLEGAIARFVGSLVGTYVLALIIDALAPTFAAQKNAIQALKVAAYSSTAAWVAGIFLIMPSLGMLSILGIYSLYLFFLGLPLLMKVPEDKAMGYTIAVIVAAIVLYACVGLLVSQLVGVGVWGRPNGPFVPQ